MKTTCRLTATFALLLMLVASSEATDWTQFRGPNGAGISDDAAVPLSWSETENVKWKSAMPGPGSSSPIVLGDKIFLTCYTGYGIDRDNPGDPEDLKRHLLCINRADGKILWDKSVDGVDNEDTYRGFVREHGYASHTPITDGEHIYAFLGKSGVAAYDLEGNQLWLTSVGTESNSKAWGSAASPILYKDRLIINASDECRSVLALDKATGEEIWRAEASSLDCSFNTPVLVELPDGGTEVVVAVPYEVWGLNPDSGKLAWYVELELDNNISPSIVTSGDIAYVFGGFRKVGSAAIRAGGKGDVTDKSLVWFSKQTSYVPSPLLYENNLYWVNEQGYAHCMNAETTDVVYRERLKMSGSKPVYASVLKAGDRIYAVSRTSGTYVLAAKPEFEVLSHNTFASDTTDFNASPAVSDGQMFLRSNKFLYCLESD